MAEDWVKLEKHFAQKEISNLKIGEVDCTASQPLCSKHGVPGYPTIFLFKDGQKHIDYRFNRDFERMKVFLDEELGKASETSAMEPNDEGIYELNSHNWKQMQTNKTFEAVVVKFCIQESNKCIDFEQLYEDLVMDFELEDVQNIAFAEVDCSEPESSNLCLQEGIKTYPSVQIYQHGGLEDTFEGESSLLELVNFVWLTVDPSKMVEQEMSMDPKLWETIESFYGQAGTKSDREVENNLTEEDNENAMGNEDEGENNMEDIDIMEMDEFVFRDQKDEDEQIKFLTEAIMKNEAEKSKLNKDAENQEMPVQLKNKNEFSEDYDTKYDDHDTEYEDYDTEYEDYDTEYEDYDTEYEDYNTEDEEDYKGEEEDGFKMDEINSMDLNDKEFVGAVQDEELKYLIEAIQENEAEKIKLQTNINTKTITEDQGQNVAEEPIVDASKTETKDEL